MQLMSSIQQIFQIDYPLPKVDLLAVHEFVSLDPIHPEQSTFELVSTIFASNSSEQRAPS